MSDPLLNQNADAGAPSSNPEVRSGAVAPLRRDDFDRDVWCLMGLAVDVADITRAVGEIDDAARTGRKLSFVTPNVNFLVRALKDPTARREILNADLSLADGAPLILMAKFLGVPLPSRVAGSDLFEALRRRPGYSGRPLKVFFFGGRPGAAEAACNALNGEKGGIEAVGWHNPGFGDVESMSSDEVIAKVNAAEPDFVMVALGAAKGQAWIEHNRDRLTAPVTAHLGAVVDFTAGGVARAPEWMQRSGLEWLWRIKEEPSLWRRYFSDGLALAKLAATGLLPQMLRNQMLQQAGQAGSVSGPASAPVSGEARIEIEHTPNGTLIRLAGQLGHDGLKPVREAFRAAAAAGQSVCLDLAGVEAIDRAFLGQVLMLEKQLGLTGAEITLKDANSNVRALFRANKMDYAQAAQNERVDQPVTVRKAAL